MTNIVPLASSWAVLAAVVLGLIIYRRMISSHEDDTLHFDATTTAQQDAVAHKLETIDKYGKILTAITVIYGLVVAVVYFMNIWNSAPSY